MEMWHYYDNSVAKPKKLIIYFIIIQCPIRANLNKYFNILNNRIIDSFTSYEDIILIKYKINCYGDHDDKNQFNNIKIITR